MTTLTRAISISIHDLAAAILDETIGSLARALPHCVACGGYVWPWQARGVSAHGYAVHRRSCARLARPLGGVVSLHEADGFAARVEPRRLSVTVGEVERSLAEPSENWSQRR